jgi:hypothetical protein
VSDRTKILLWGPSLYPGLHEVVLKRRCASRSRERTREGEEQVHPLPRPQGRLQGEDVRSPTGETLATSPPGYPQKRLARPSCAPSWSTTLALRSSTPPDSTELGPYSPNRRVAHLRIRIAILFEAIHILLILTLLAMCSLSVLYPPARLSNFFRRFLHGLPRFKLRRGLDLRRPARISSASRS